MEEISSSKESSSTLGNYLLDIREFILHFINCKIQYGSCACNSVAYKLAKNAWHVNDIVMWFGEMPPFLKHTIW